MEELSVGGKLIRPRYECVEEHRPIRPWTGAEQVRAAGPSSPVRRGILWKIFSTERGNNG